MTEAFLIGGPRTPVGRMERELATGGRKLGQAMMCVGFGQGTALLLAGVS